MWNAKKIEDPLSVIKAYDSLLRGFLIKILNKYGWINKSGELVFVSDDLKRLTN